MACRWVDPTVVWGSMLADEKAALLEFSMVDCIVCVCGCGW